jgi:hypothetical protein
MDGKGGVILDLPRQASLAPEIDVPSSPLSRRDFLASCLLAPTLAFLPRGAPHCDHHVGRAGQGDHPTPRPGIDASRVLKASELKDAPDAIVAFDEVRQIPQIVDGIRCNCGCAKLKGYYSLLSCYETADAMAKTCQICQGQGRYAYRLHKAGKSLGDIRTAIDARYR